MRGQRACVAAMIAATVILLLTGCDLTPADSAEQPEASTRPTVNVDGYTPVPAPAITPTGQDGQETAEMPAPASTDAPPGVVIPSGDLITLEAAGKAEVAALRFVEAFTRKDLAGQAWEDGYLPLLTPYSQTAYQGTGQSNVPGTRVTGSPALAEGGTNTVTAAMVSVPTDAGTYRVQVYALETGAWLVQRAFLPGSAS